MFSSMNIFGSLKSSTSMAPAVSVTGKKKRRRNKKKKSASGKHANEEGPEDEDEDDDDNENDTENENVNDNFFEQSSKLKSENNPYQADPIATIIEDITRRSNFERSKVHAVVMKMWDNGLKYDDEDAILEQLNMQDDCDFAVDEEEENVKLVEEMSRLSTPSSIPAEAECQINAEIVPGPEPEITLPASAAVPKPVPEPQMSESPPQHAGVEVVETPLPARLEAAAAHSDLPVALAALCAWASVADADGMKDFFNARALEIILQRVLSDCNKSMLHEVRSGLSTLLHHVLRLPPSSSGSATVTALVESLESLTVQVQSLKSLTNTSTGHSFLSDSLAHRIGMSIRRLNAVMLSLYNGGSVQVTIANLDAALAETSAAIDKHIDDCRNDSMRPSATIDLKSTFIQRELLHERFLLELQAAETLREAALQPRTILSPPRLGGTVEDDESLEAALLAEVGETRASIAAKKSQAQATRSYVDRVMQEHDNARSSISLELKACIDHIGVLQGRYDDMVLQLQRIEREISQASSKRATLQTKLMDEQKRYDERLSSLDGSQGQVMVALRIEDGARSLVTSVRDLETSLTGVVAGVQRPLAPPAEEYPVRVAATSDALGAYAESEAKCISALANRVHVVENRLQLLRREADEYRALDMQTIGAELEGTIQKLTENAVEDTQTLSALRTALSEAIQRFASCLTVDLAGVGMVAMPSAALSKAVTCLLDAGVSIPDELAPFVVKPVTIPNGDVLGPPPGLDVVVARSPDVPSPPPSASPSLLSINRTSFQPHVNQTGQERLSRQQGDNSKGTAGSVQRPGSLASKSPLPGKSKKGFPPPQPQATKLSNQSVARNAKPVPVGARSVLKPAPTATSPAVPPTKSSWAGWKVPISAANTGPPDSIDIEVTGEQSVYGTQDLRAEDTHEPSSELSLIESDMNSNGEDALEFVQSDGRMRKSRKDT